MSIFIIIKKFRWLVLGLGLIASAVGSAAQTPEDKLAALKLTLPPVNKALANYVPAVRSGNLLFLAGHISRDAEGKVITGKVGSTADETKATDAAQRAGLALIATLKAELGDLRRVKRIVRVGGFVCCTDDFTRQSGVINGCSDLLVGVFGDAGRHARAAIGSNALPLGALVEIELIAEVSD